MNETLDASVARLSRRLSTPSLVVRTIFGVPSTSNDEGYEQLCYSTLRLTMWGVLHSKNVCFAAVRKQNQVSEFGSLYYFVSFLISSGIVTMRDPLLKTKFLQTSNFR